MQFDYCVDCNIVEVVKNRTYSQMSNTYADMFMASAMIMSLLWLRNLFIVDAFLRKFRI